MKKNLIRLQRFYSLVIFVVAFGLPVLAQGTVNLTLLQLNDVYQISPVDKGKAGGLARIATLKKDIQKKAGNVVFCLSGDTISPSVASTIFRGKQMIALWNELGLDLACLGNHEFDFGNDVLKERISESRFTWLGSNVVYRSSGKSFDALPRYVIRNIDGIKVGFFGLVTTETRVSSKAGKDLEFRDPLATARQISAQLKAKGASVIVAITHLTMEEDKRLAATGLVDVILGGHEHEFLQSMSGRTPIFKWGSDARNLGRIDLRIDRRTRRLRSMDWAAVPVTEAVKPDEAAQAIVDDYERKVSAQLDAPVGSISVDLDATTLGSRTRETNAGNLIADAFREATGAETALINGGSIRVDRLIPAGNWSRRDSLAMLPFENQVIKIEIAGSVIKSALENGVKKANGNTSCGCFPQVSGIRFEFDARRMPGARVTKVEINGVALDEARLYTMALTTFTANGGDDYSMFKGARRLINAEGAQIDSEIVSRYIESKVKVSPVLDGRIRRIE